MIDEQRPLTGSTPGMSAVLGLLLFLVLGGTLPAWEAIPNLCQLCSKPFTTQVYSAIDSVTEEKRFLCDECVVRDHRCFACGLPIVKDMTSLSDGRHYCARDARRAVIQSADIQGIVVEAQKQLHQLLGDQISFPTELTDIHPVDRVTIEAMFARPGNDFACPNILGFYRTVSDQGERRHDISLLAGLSASGTRAVYAHELTHAWLADHLPAGRKLGRDAQEGFCELVAHLLLEHLNDQEGLRAIRKNAYTRGQFELFLQAQRTHHLSTVIEWLKFGTEPLLDESDPEQVRRTKVPTRPAKPLWVLPSGAADAAARPAGQERLQLKAVVGSEKRRTALINNRTLMAGEKSRIQIGDETVEIEVLEIGEDFVRVVRTGGGEETLRLPAR
ncbi:MAG TPA: hypothetical protein DCY13_11640 [Verrucomicrobiales bacterium]|nr:hypothetical protein [Verrucomicrobiales bacterium]